MSKCGKSLNVLPHSDVDSASATTTAGPRIWRSLEELADDPEVLNAIQREFPSMLDHLQDAPSRREFLRVMGASISLASVTGCMRQPEEKIVPYVRAPEQIVPGIPLYYATAMTHAGAAVGLLVESHMGRPVKVEGNPRHPSVPEAMARANERSPAAFVRFGATDAFAQAAVLTLYDPDRSQTVLRSGQIDTWETFFTQLREQLARLEATGGRGLRVLTETVVSPTLAEQLQQLLNKYPNAAWHQYEAINDDQATVGSRLAFGVDVAVAYDFEKADIILSLDADFLADGPSRLLEANRFSSRRKQTAAGTPSMNRLYVVESSRSITGAAADQRLPVSPQGVVSFAVALAKSLGLAATATAGMATNDVPQAWIEAVLEDLRKSAGRSVVLPGRGQAPVVHAIAHWLNATLGNVGQTVLYLKPSVARVDVQTDSLRELIDAMSGGQVESLFVLGGNPAYDAPSDLKFGQALGKVPFTVHLSQYFDETSALCGWHIPQSHFLETWSDTRAPDGTVSIVQPLIAPLYRSKTVHEMVAALLGDPVAASHDLVRDHWRRQQNESASSASFDTTWQTWLHDGVAENTALPIQTSTIRSDFASAVEEPLARASRPIENSQLQIAFRADPSVWDGRFANNGWLQELPRPFTKITWDNAALVGPGMAKEQQLSTGDVIELQANGTTAEVPVFVVPGHPDQTITLHLGYGRNEAGRVGNGVGADVYPLRTSGSMWFAAVEQIRKTGRTYPLATTQHHHLMEGRQLVRAGTLAELQKQPEHPAFMATEEHSAPQNSLFPSWPKEGYQWGMVVNQSSCIGCNACVVACQAENNIPIVGKDQVLRGREMHWLRIDNYYEGDATGPATYHQPIMCMHCEKAPCEIVCPVAATTHSDEGLNEMTYNRCVGTRYCSNNCPYKVRRFNFYDYNAELRQDATLQLLPNPDVTVRSRGVMEKCTYCVQRINQARINSEKENRSIRDGEILTACQAACPVEALTFGNLNDRQSEASRLAASKLNYSLLGELNTRPRTTYLAVVRNPRPALAESLDESTG